MKISPRLIPQPHTGGFLSCTPASAAGASGGVAAAPTIGPIGPASGQPGRPSCEHMLGQNPGQMSAPLVPAGQDSGPTISENWNTLVQLSPALALRPSAKLSGSQLAPQA